MPSSLPKELYNPKAFFIHAAWLRQGCPHCAIFPTAASRRSLGRVSVPVWLVILSDQLEIVGLVSLAPIPMATFGNHEQSHMGQNYLKCLFALGFQGFLILICVAIYAVLIQSVAISGDAINSIWSIVGYTVLLCFSLFKTSSVTKSVLGAH